MEDILSPTDKQTMVSSFLEIAVGQTADTARQFLQVSALYDLDFSPLLLFLVKYWCYSI